MHETYFWYNKPSETIIICVNCAYNETENPTEKYNWEDTYPETPLMCDICNEEI